MRGPELGPVGNTLQKPSIRQESRDVGSEAMSDYEQAFRAHKYVLVACTINKIGCKLVMVSIKQF